MLVSASYAIASLVEETHLKEDYVIPKVTDPRICPIVTQTLKKRQLETILPNRSRTVPKRDN